MASLVVMHRRGRFFADEVRAVRGACAGHRYGLAIELALMGLRRGEIPGLHWEDFDEQAGTRTELLTTDRAELGRLRQADVNVAAIGRRPSKRKSQR